MFTLITLFVVFSIGFTIYKEKTNNKKIEQPQPKITNRKGKSTPESINDTSSTSVVKKPQVGIQIGNMAPDFELSNLDGTEVKLSSFRGKKVILNFWATWCPPCRQEMPDMEAYYEKTPKDQVVILAINLTVAEQNINDVKTFKDHDHLTFPILLESSGDVAATYQTQTIPTSYIIDSKGYIRNKMIGPMNKDWINEQINLIH